MRQLKMHKQGFTIIELLIASSVFTVVLLGAATMIVQISRLYYKGIIVSRTQTSARELTESISRPIQYENTSVVGLRPGITIPAQQVLCIGTDRYTFMPGVKQGSGASNVRHAAWKDTVTSLQECTLGPDVDLNDPNLRASSPTGRDMVSDNMRIADVQVDEVLPNAPGLWNVKVSVIYGDDDLVNPVTQTCLSQVSGSQWCSKVAYETKVFKRISN